MKNIKIYFTLFLFVLFAVSCFEDDSNYEYGTAILEENSIEMDVKTNGYTWGTPIVVKPTKFKKGPYAELETIDSTKFRWEYYLPDFAEDPSVPVCTTFTFQRELWKEGAVLSTSYSGMLRAIDSLGNKFDASFSVKYAGYAYPTSNRWVLLAENSAGESVLHLVQGTTDTSKLVVYKDIAKVGSGPRRIYFAPNYSVFGVEEASSGLTYVHPYTYATYRTPEQFFEGGAIPAGEVLKEELSLNGSIGLMWCQSGKVFVKIFEKKADHSKVRYSTATLKHEDGTDVDCGYILTRYENAYVRTDLVIYDKTRKGLYHVCGKDLKHAGKVVPVLAPTSNVNLPEPNNLDGYDVLYAEMDGYYQKYYNMILRKDGKYYYYQVTYAIADYYTSKIARSTQIKFNEITDYSLGFADDVNLYDIESNPRYIYFVPDLDRKSIYYYDFNTQKVGVYMKFDGGDNITRISFRNDNASYQPKTYMGVAKGKEFYLLNAADGYMSPQVAYDQKIMKKFDFDSKIVGFTFK